MVGNLGMGSADQCTTPCYLWPVTSLLATIQTVVAVRVAGNKENQQIQMTIECLLGQLIAIKLHIELKYIGIS